MKQALQFLKALFVYLPLMLIYTLAMYIGERRSRGYIVIAAISLSSCGAAKYVSNPSPNMKTVHMATEHWNYTQIEYDLHPDYDCSKIKVKKLGN